MDDHEAEHPGGTSPTVVLHAGGHWHGAIRDGQVDFFAMLSERLTDAGITTRLVSLGSSASDVLLQQGHVNIVVGNEPAAGRNRLHATPAYVWGFWYFDPEGVHWRSSIRRARFDPDSVDGAAAEYFFNGVAGYMLRENVSRIPQPALVEDWLEPADAVIFCQEIEALADAPHHLTTEEMIRTTAAAAKGLVYVKPHPGQSRAAERRIGEVAEACPNVRISDASVHDLNQAARVVVTQNSAAGFEALMQRKPVITCARSDFWHATLTPRSPRDLAEAVRHGPEVMARFAYEKYLWWFLEGHCLEPQREDFGDRLLARIAERVR